MKFILTEATSSVTDESIMLAIDMARKIALDKFPEYAIFIDGIVYKMTSATSFLGQADLIKRQIELSYGLIGSSQGELLETILHEIAHLLDFKQQVDLGNILKHGDKLIYNPKLSKQQRKELLAHGKSWQRIAKQLGHNADGVTGSTKTFDRYCADNVKYKLKCTKCGALIGDYMRLTGAAAHPEKYRCGACKGDLVVLYKNKGDF